MTNGSARSNDIYHTHEPIGIESLGNVRMDQ